MVLQLAGDGFTAIGVMNRLSGSTEEILEVSGQDTKRQVVNLAEVIDHKGQPTVRRRGDWVPVARQRGIEQAVLAFLDAVRAGKVLSARDALATHELCERVVRARARSGPAPPEQAARPRRHPGRRGRARPRAPASRRTGRTA